jgi:cell shape-determining protein MreC
LPSINSKKQFLSLPLTIGLIVVCLLLLLFDGIGFFNTVKSSGHSIGIKITEKSSSGIESLFTISDLFKDKREALLRVEELETDLLTLRSENAKLSTLLKELEVIKEQNTFTNPAETLPASVTAYISDRYGYVIINKGSANNVKTGDAVVLKNLFLGQIVEVNKTNSIVRLINSPDTVIPALSIDNNAKGVVKGDFSIGLIMTDIPRGSTINKGESILTSSENEIIQKGLILGEVVSIEDSDSLTTKSAELKIIPDLRNLSEVFILRIERDNE